jgi:DNA ligase (NAD+)
VQTQPFRPWALTNRLFTTRIAAVETTTTTTTTTPDWVQELRGQLQVCIDAYYTDGTSSLSDADFDAAYARLQVYEDGRDCPENLTGKINTPRVELLGKAQTQRHMEPMLSLRSTTEREKVTAFDATVRRLLQNLATTGVLTDQEMPPDQQLKYWFEIKYDGIAVSLTYDSSGVFQRALTRGNGRYGELVSSSLQQLVQFPHTIDVSALELAPEETLEVRGEVMLHRSLLDAATVKTSPRNYVAGLLRRQRQSSGQTAVADEDEQVPRLDLICYSLLFKSDQDAEGVPALPREEMRLHSSRLRFLSSAGFTVDSQSCSVTIAMTRAIRPSGL